MFPVYYSDRYAVPLPPKHPFPILKYALLRRALLDSRTIQPQQLQEPEPVTREQLCLAHEERYVLRVLNGALSAQEVRRIGLPWTPQLVMRSRCSVGGTVLAARAALRDGLAGNLAGGTHHAHADYGSGYCTFNDVAVAVKMLHQENRAERILIVDLDVHQGDGTARIFAKDERVFTFSMHGARNFPFRKAQSDLDIPLPDGTQDAAYLAQLDAHLPRIFERAKPDLVFYLAGADPLHNDRLGRLGLSLEGLKVRDERVVGACGQRGIPLVLTLSGGYGQPIEDTVAAHVNTYRVVCEVLVRGV